MMINQSLRYKGQWIRLFLALILAALVMIPGTGLAAPKETLVSATVDVIVAVDTTGSMGGWIRQVREETAYFANQLEAEGFDYRLGLLDFKDIRRDGGPWWHGFTDDSSVFNSQVDRLYARGGGDAPESDINAMYNAYYKFKEEGRSTAGRMLILITDAPFISSENGYNVNGIGKLLNDNNIVLNIIGSGADSRGQARDLDELTRGVYYDTNNLRTAYEGIIAQILKNRPPQIKQSQVVLPPGVDPGSIHTSTDVQFNLEGWDPDGDDLRYHWQAVSPGGRAVAFGDTPTIRVRLPEPGIWRVTGTITDPSGESVSVTHQIAIGNQKPSVSNLRLDSANTPTPKISWDFRDPEGQLQAKMRLKVKKSGAVIWDSGVIDSTNPYGIARGMAYGGDYTIEVQAMDQYDAWSDWTSLTAHINALPDLRSLTLTTTPAASVLNQDMVTANVQVKNEGEQTADAFHVALYDDGHLVGEQTVFGLANGKQTNVSLRFKAVNPKTHTLKAVVDSGKQVREGNESNNEIAGSIQVLNRVDLVPTLSFLPANTVPQGGKYAVRIVVTNAGQGVAGAFLVEVYQNASRIAQKTIEGLDAGAAASLDIPNLQAATAGDQTFKVVVDPTDQLAESNESNNTAQASLQVVAPQEIKGLRFTTTPDGRSITAHWEEPTDPFFDHVKLFMAVGTSDEVSSPMEKGIKQWTFDHLIPETIYKIWVVTVNTAGTASPGVEQNISTPRDSVPPDDVKNVVVTPIPAGGAIKVTWQDPVADDFKAVRIAYRPTGGIFSDAILVAKGTQQLILNELTNGVPYEIQLKALDIYGNASSGKTVTGTPKDVVPPGEVSNVEITSGPQGRAIHVQWTDPKDADYRFTELRLLNQDGSPVGEPVRVAKGKEKYDFLHVKPETEYRIQLTTIDADDNRSAGIKQSLRTARDTTPPQAVTHLEVEADKQNGTLHLTWTDPKDEDLAEVYVFLKEDQEEAAWKEAGRISAGVESAALKPVANQSYVIKAIAVDDQGNQSQPVAVGTTLLLAKPLKPIDLRFNKWGQSQVIQWREAGNILPVSYKLYRQMSGEDEAPKVIATLPAGSTRYVEHLNLEAWQRVVYEITAVDRDGTESDRAGPVGPATSFTDSPILRLIDSSSSEVKLASTVVEGAKSYRLERRESGGWEEVQKTSDVKESISWVDRKIQPGLRYQYRVIAQRDTIQAVSAPIFVTVSSAAPDVPADVKAKLDGDKIRVSWQPPEGAAEAYNIYRQKDDGPILLIKSRLNDGLEYTDDAAHFDGSCTYYVSAWQDGKESGKVAALPIGIGQTSPAGWGSSEDDPKDHTGEYIHVEQVGESVRVSWKAAEGTPAHYFVYRQEVGSLYQKLVATLAGDRLTFIDHSARVGRTYIYAVQAQYRETYGSTMTKKFEANPIQVVPEDGIAPTAVFDPANVTAAVHDDAIQITWEVPKAAKEYMIYRREAKNPFNQLIGRVPGAKGTVFVDTSAKPGHTYEYFVLARYPGGNSAMVKSNAITIP